MANENNLKPIQILPPFKHFCCTIGALPSSYLESMTYYEMLNWFCDYLKNTVIPTINNNAESIKELQGLYIILKNYVDNYFKNLDVQEEINNKLDEMAESGQLENLIAQFLRLNSLLTFNNVNDLKNSINLINGSFAKTLGFYNLNDNGGAFYKIRQITNNDIINNMNLIPLKNPNLVAELIIENNVNLKQLGANPNNEISNILQFAIDLCKEKYNIIVDDFYTLSNPINIDKPIVIKGLPSLYSNAGKTGFMCNGEDIIYFNFNEGSTNCLFEHITFNGNGFGTALKFSSRDEKITNLRVWKNQFNKCTFANFNTGILFFAIGDVTEYDYSSEMLFLDCKFYNNNISCIYNNTQSYNTNFISTDFETSPDKHGIGFLLNAYGGININGGSIILRDSLIKLSQNPDLTPPTNFLGIINISNCRFETFTETIFDYTLTSRNATYQFHSLNMCNTDFYPHSDGTLINTNVRGLNAQLNFSLTSKYKLLVNGQNQQAASDYSKIIINTTQPENINVQYNTGVYKPWIIVNNIILSSCVSNVDNHNIFEYNNKINLGFNKTNLPSSFNVKVPWYYRKFVININGAFIGNTGNITISSGDFSYTFNKTQTGTNQIHDEVFLPYNSNTVEYTITPTNIWGNCYFE